MEGYTWPALVIDDEEMTEVMPDAAIEVKPSGKRDRADSVDSPLWWAGVNRDYTVPGWRPF